MAGLRPIMANRLGWILAPMLVFGSVSLTAADGRTPAKPASASRSSSKIARTATILGAAWNADNTPITGAHLRLRNVVTGKVAAVATASDTGQFTFENVDPGSYTVELVTDSGHVLTVGHVFTIAQGETVATFVRLAPKVPWVAAIFNNTAANVAAVAATEGIAAIRPSGYCQSPPCQ